MNIKKHNSKWEEDDIYKIPYNEDYKFLGIQIDDKGSI